MDDTPGGEYKLRHTARSVPLRRIHSEKAAENTVCSKPCLLAAAWFFVAVKFAASSGKEAFPCSGKKKRNRKRSK